ncbi:MAG: methyltransferase domain-containing protein [Desulfosarcina sp.]|nr:methyltransferase domain-containing protein [Desulfosarcina sp.]
MSWIKKFLLFEEPTCPWWMAYAWDHRLRRWVHDTDIILKPYLTEGDRVAEVGCGMGYFSITMADYVGASGKIFAVDLQQQMLDGLNRCARNHNAGYMAKQGLE